MASNRPIFLRPLENSFTPYREMIRWRRRFWLAIAMWIGTALLLFFRR